MFLTDEPLWYNNGVWGELGYAVPNFGDDPTTLNSGIHYLVDAIGRNLSAVMHHTDADLRTPPSINTLTRVHKLVTRARSILAGREVPPATPNMEAQHVSPAPMVHIIYPAPYFKVRNRWLKEWCGLILCGMSEAMQHTENRKAYEFSTDFSGLVGQYLHRVYRLMATELFGVSREEASSLAFTLTPVQLASYDPGKFFTSTELIDTVPPVAQVPTEDDLKVVTDGIPATVLVGLCKYPSGAPEPTVQTASTTTASTSESTSASTANSFSPPPSP